jgi:hypothetical protein
MPPPTPHFTTQPVPVKRYETIVMDPPWPMTKIERDVRPNQVAFDYAFYNPRPRRIAAATAAGSLLIAASKSWQAASMLGLRTIFAASAPPVSGRDLPLSSPFPWLSLGSAGRNRPASRLTVS